MTPIKEAFDVWKRAQPDGYDAWDAVLWATERAAKQERKAVQEALRHAGLTLIRTVNGLQVMAAITDAQAESAAIRAAGGAKA